MITFGSLDWFAETDEVSSSRVALGDRAQMYRWEAVRVFEGQVYSLLVGFSTNALLKKNSTLRYSTLIIHISVNLGNEALVFGLVAVKWYRRAWAINR